MPLIGHGGTRIPIPSDISSESPGDERTPVSPCGPTRMYAERVTSYTEVTC